MAPKRYQATHSMSTNLRHLAEYKDTINQLFPALPRPVVDLISFKDDDAHTLARFLDRFPTEVTVLEIGTFVGVSTFHLASQPKVSEVLSVDINSELAREEVIGFSSEELGISIDPEPLRNLRPLEVAQAALARFPEQRQKVQLVEGDVGSVDVPVPTDGSLLVAFVDGDHAKESVEGDLRTIFEKNPHAVAVLHDCQVPWPRAGIAAFVKASRARYRFCLLERFDPQAGPPTLGVLYSEGTADLADLAADLLADPTPLLLEAWEKTYRLNRRRKRLQKRIDRLEARLARQRRKTRLQKLVDRFEARLARQRRKTVEKD